MICSAVEDVKERSTDSWWGLHISRSTPEENTDTAQQQIV
jgi:hypothetical protein